MTECTPEQFEFQGLGRRRVVADFQGGHISSDGGGLLLQEVERRRGWLRDLAGCFTDHRSAALVEHSVEELVSQRVLGLALGYEDLNDHDHLRLDPLLAVLCGKEDPTGQGRRCPEDRGKALAGKSTLTAPSLRRPVCESPSRSTGRRSNRWSSCMRILHRCRHTSRRRRHPRYRQPVVTSSEPSWLVSCFPPCL